MAPAGNQTVLVPCSAYDLIDIVLFQCLYPRRAVETIALTQAAVVGEDINGVFVRMSMETRLPYMGISCVHAVT